MRVVLDTNVLIAAMIAQGVCSELLEHCVLHHDLVSSTAILHELRDKLVGKFKYGDQEADAAVGLVLSQMELVVPGRLTPPVCRDPDDDMVLATAVAGRADCIVTGDKDLPVVERFQGIEVLRPSSFAAYEASRRQT